MELLKKYTKVLARFVRISEATHDLRVCRLISPSEEELLSDMETAAMEMERETCFLKLLNVLENKKDYTGVIKLIEYIRGTHPVIAAVIPALYQAERMRFSIGTKIVRIFETDYFMAVDIREYEVSSFF
jgi:hypothetical protein